MRKAKARCENVCQFIVPVVRPLSGSTAEAAEEPAASGDEQRLEDERERPRCRPPKPSARMVAISRAALGDRRVHGVERAEHRADAP